MASIPGNACELFRATAAMKKLLKGGEEVGENW
jgi:hypothetical protein